MQMNKIWLVPIVFLLGCAVVTYQPKLVTVDQIESITPGMTIAQVQAILGKPYKISLMYEGNRDEKILVHQYSVRYNVYPYDKRFSALLDENQIEGKWTYRMSRYFHNEEFDHVYYLQFVYEDSVLLKYEPYQPD